jgi:hypothetical protein
MLQTGAKLLELADLTTRLAAIEAVLAGQRRRPDEDLG